MNSQLRDKLLAERQGFTFFAREYESLPSFCSNCKMIGHSLSNCWRNQAVNNDVRNNLDYVKPGRIHRKIVSKYLEKNKGVTNSMDEAVKDCT